MSRPIRIDRRRLMATALAAGSLYGSRSFAGMKRDPEWDKGIAGGLNWLAKQQKPTGSWPEATYPVAISALSAIAVLMSGSTTTQGPYADHIRRAVDYFLGQQRANGLIGDLQRDNHYTYGHGFSMLFLSQVLGEEEDEDRRNELIEALQRAVDFSGKAQTSAGGWGYVAAKAINDFDEGSTTITQVQALRGCRNAGIVVPGEIIEKAKKYIYDCMNPDGGISYSSRNLGQSRPAITAAALATLYNAGDYDSVQVPKMMEYARKNLHDLVDNGSVSGFWHYAYLYYSQVVYRQGEQEWTPFRDRLYARLLKDQKYDAQLKQGTWDNVYVTAANLIMLQLDRGSLPIFQR